jgi:hypothetical protein
MRQAKAHQGQKMRAPFPEENAVEVKPTYTGTMISLATVAFGLLAAGAWNKAIADLFAIFLKSGSGVAAEIGYAIAVTIVAILVIEKLAKFAERDPRTPE